MAIRETLIALAVLAWGCTPQAYNHELSPNHPASPEAQEGIQPEPSTTLTVGDTPSSSGGHEMKDQAGSMERMNHAEHTSREATPVASRAGEALYQCPMHPEVTSTDPGRRCPKCNMKINKPVKDGGATPDHEGHGGHSQ